jgi:hypothetical protein
VVAAALIDIGLAAFLSCLLFSPRVVGLLSAAEPHHGPASTKELVQAVQNMSCCCSSSVVLTYWRKLAVNSCNHKGAGSRFCCCLALTSFAIVSNATHADVADLLGVLSCTCYNADIQVQPAARGKRGLQQAAHAAAVRGLPQATAVTVIGQRGNVIFKPFQATKRVSNRRRISQPIKQARQRFSG